MQPVQIRLVLHTERDLQHRDTAMAPTCTSAAHVSMEYLPSINKLRKPVVEKMRRDRINSSIEQLKSLLAPEFLNQKPDSKLERADILEMTVSFLRRRQQQEQQQSEFCSNSAAASQGFSRCAHELVHFLSKEEVETQTQRILLNQFQNLETASEKNRRECPLSHMNIIDQQNICKEKSSARSTLWRPW